MNLSVLKHVHLTTIPSASAVEIINGNIYIMAMILVLTGSNTNEKHLASLMNTMISLQH